MVVTPKIICGDAFELLAGMPDRCVDHIITDPPYDFTSKQIGELHNHFLRVARNWVIVFAPPENQWVLPAQQYGFWVKPISTKNTSKRYSRFVEMIFFYGDGPWDASRHWSQYTNTFHDLVDDSKLHPFRKPKSLLERLIRNHTERGQSILDPFCGSGSLMSVAKTLGRPSTGIELDPIRFEALERRFGSRK